MTVADEPTEDELRAAHCWEDTDRVPGRPATTAFRRRLRLHHARWREANGLPIGTQPIRPRPEKPSRRVGSRVPLELAQETGAPGTLADVPFEHSPGWLDLDVLGNLSSLDAAVTFDAPDGSTAVLGAPRRRRSATATSCLTRFGDASTPHVAR